MWIGALIIASALAGASPSLPAPQASSLAGPVKDACFATDMSRTALRTLARRHHWSAAIPIVRGQADIDRLNADPNWTDVYGTDDGVLIEMSGPKDHQPDAAVCTVSLSEPTADWVAEIGAVASGEGLSTAVAPQDSDGAETFVWTSDEGRKLMAVYTAADRHLAVTLSRDVGSAP